MLYSWHIYDTTKGKGFLKIPLQILNYIIIFYNQDYLKAYFSRKFKRKGYSERKYTYLWILTLKVSETLSLKSHFKYLCDEKTLPTDYVYYCVSLILSTPVSILITKRMNHLPLMKLNIWETFITHLENPYHLCFL